MTAAFTTITNREYYETIRADSRAAGGGETQWTINKNAKPGDTVLLYVCAPISAIVATAIVLDSPFRDEDLNSEWYGKHFADLGDLKMLELPITRAELLTKFPDWKYWTQPRNSVEVKKEYLPELEKMLGGN